MLALLLCLTGGITFLDTASQVSGASPSATIATDKPIYYHGELILVTIHNDRDTVIYIDANHASCIVGIYRLRGREWMAEEICPPPRVAAFLLLAPGGVLMAALGAASTPNIYGPIVSGPTSPDSSKRDLRTLPVKPSRPSSSHTRERTRGIFEPESNLGTKDGLLAPGTYRLELKATIGSINGRTEIIRSDEFFVVQ
jgi:hypothetical protein